MWSTSDAASRWEGTGGKQLPLLDAAQDFKKWTRTLAGGAEEVPPPAAPPLPQGPHAFLKQN